MHIILKINKCVQLCCLQSACYLFISKAQLSNLGRWGESPSTPTGEPPGSRLLVSSGTFSAGVNSFKFLQTLCKFSLKTQWKEGRRDGESPGLGIRWPASPPTLQLSGSTWGKSHSPPRLPFSHL